MEKSLKNLMSKLTASGDSFAQMGFVSIKGGARLLQEEVEDPGNNTKCTNDATCSSSNTGGCTNGKDCTNTSNSAGLCTNSTSCFM